MMRRLLVALLLAFCAVTPIASALAAKANSPSERVEQSSNGEDAEHRWFHAYGEWRSGDKAKAESELKAFLKDYPSHRRASYAGNLLGELYYERGDYALAAKAFLTNYQTIPNGDRAQSSLVRLAETLFRLQRPASDICKVYAELIDVYGSKASRSAVNVAREGAQRSSCPEESTRLSTLAGNLDTEDARQEADLKRQLAQTMTDRDSACPNGVDLDNSACLAAYKSEHELRGELGEDVRHDAITVAEEERAQTRAAAARQSSEAFNQTMLNTYTALANRTIPRVGRISNDQGPLATSRVNNPAAAGSSSVFGPLQAGVGTAAQRSFWASRCQNQSNDGSGAARGCEQTLQSLGKTPVTLPPSQPLAVGGLTTDFGSVHSPGGGLAGGSGQEISVPVHCVSLTPGKRAWLHNGCGFGVMVSYCTTTAEAGPSMQCSLNRGGLDTISAGADMNTAIGLGNDDYSGPYHLRWVACRGIFSSTPVRPQLSNQGLQGACSR